MTRPGETSVAERTDAPPLELAPPELGNRTADEPSIVRWVARNVDVRHPDPRTCPDPFAWTLLRECRETPGFMATFLEKCWVKLIPPRSQLESAGPKVQDGRSVIELTDRILAHAHEAEGVSLAASMASPKKTTPSAFEAFDPKEDACRSSKTRPAPAAAPPAAPQSATATTPARRVPPAARGATSPAPPASKP